MKNIYVLITINIVIFYSSLNAQWVRTNLPYSGNVTSLAAESNISGGTNLFAGTEGGGVFLSTDDGNSWQTANNGLGDSSVYSLIISGANIFAGTRNGVFRSTDNGTNWTSANTGLPSDYRVSAFTASNNGEGETNLFAGTDGGGVFLSTNNGTNWGAVNDGFPRNTSDTATYLNVTTLTVSPNGAGGTNLFAGTNNLFGFPNNGVFFSTNNGTSWTATGLHTYINSLAVSPNGVDGTNLFAGTGGGFSAPSENGVFLSTNNGKSWTATSTGLDSSWVFALATSTNEAGGTNLFAGTSYGVFLSTNNGTSWKPVNTGLPDYFHVYGWITAFAVVPNGSGGNNLFAATNVDGVWRRPLSKINTSAIPAAGLQLWLKADEGVRASGSSVSSWIDQSGNGNDATQSNFDRQPSLVNNGLNNKPLLHFDGINDMLGLTGTKPMSQISLFLVFKIDSGLVGNDGTDPFPYYPVVFGNPNINGKAYGLGMRNYYSANSPDIIGPWVGEDSYVFSESPNIAAFDQWKVLSVITNQKMWNTTVRSNGVDAVITPQGTTNESLSFPLGRPDGTVGIGGAVNVPAGHLIFKGDIAEVIVYDTALSNEDRLSVEKYLNDKYNIAITAVNEQTNSSLPERFSLSQNYPNPFNPSTTISFSIPASEFVTLKIYDILGREVATLVNETKTRGSYEVNFNAASLSSGVYFYRLQSGSFVETKKLLLLK